MNSRVGHIPKLSSARSLLLVVVGISLLAAACPAGSTAAPPEKIAPPGKKALPRVDWAWPAIAVIVPLAFPQGILGKEFDEVVLLFDRWSELDVAVYTHIARRGLDGQARQQIDEVLREVRRRRPSWETTYNLVGAAIAESEDSLSRKYPKARIGARLVAVLYTGHVARREREESFSFDDFEFFQRSSLSSLLDDLNEFAGARGPDARRVKSTKPDQPSEYQRSMIEEDQQALLILRHFQWFSLADAELARGQNAEQVATETLRRAPATATLSITYQVLQPAGGSGDGVGIASLSLETAKHQFACNPAGWQRQKPNFGPIPKTQGMKKGDR